MSKSIKSNKSNKYSYSEITSVLKSIVGGPRVSNDRFTYYTKTSGIVIRNEKGIKVRSDVYEAATKATTPQALELVETAKLVFKSQDEAKAKFSVASTPTTPKIEANLTPSFSAINAVLIGIMGGVKAPIADFLGTMRVKGGQDQTPILHRHQAKTSRGKSGLRLRHDIYVAAKAASTTDASAAELITNADLVWNNPEAAFAKLSGTPVAEVAPVVEPTPAPVADLAPISE